MSPVYGPEAKRYGALLTFDPSAGETIIAPEGEGAGHWAGAPSVLYDAETSRFYLYYRLRKPRPVRGGLCYIAESDDGLSFRTIWGARKEDFGSASVERFALTRALDGKWLLYPSYVDPDTNRWRIDVIQADGPGGFDPAQRQPLLLSEDLGVQGVKDPWVMIVNGLYYMLVSYAVTIEQPEQERERLHATGDVYNTGLTLSCTGLATGGDGRRYHWQGDIFGPRAGAWDAYAARLGCLAPTASGWLGYYDGGASVEENYEERSGLVHSWDLRSFYRLSAGGPSLVSPHGSGSLRYIDAVMFDDEVWFYYEYCRPDGSHELRLNRVKR
jgi:hypothetical protein